MRTTPSCPTTPPAVCGVLYTRGVTQKRSCGCGCGSKRGCTNWELFNEGSFALRSPQCPPWFTIRLKTNPLSHLTTRNAGLLNALCITGTFNFSYGREQFLAKTVKCLEQYSGVR